MLRPNEFANKRPNGQTILAGLGLGRGARLSTLVSFSFVASLPSASPERSSGCTAPSPLRGRSISLVRSLGYGIIG